MPLNSLTLSRNELNPQQREKLNREYSYGHQQGASGVRDGWAGVPEAYARQLYKQPGDMIRFGEILYNLHPATNVLGQNNASDAYLKAAEWVDEKLGTDYVDQIFEEIESRAGGPSLQRDLAQVAGMVTGPEDVLIPGAVTAAPFVAKALGKFGDEAVQGAIKTPLRGQEGAVKFFQNTPFESAIDARGNMRLTHYATQQLRVVDPAYFGKGLSGRTIAEMNRLSGPDAVKRSYFAIDVADNTYVRERGLGTIENKAKIDAAGIYDPKADPAGLWGRPKTAEEVTKAEKRVFDAGYKGVAFNTDRGPVAMVFEPTRVPLAAADRPRVDFTPASPPELTRKSVGNNPWKAGAPVGIKSTRGEKKILDNYLVQAEKGAAGRLWYDVRHEQIGRDVGYRPGLRDIQAIVTGNFSPRTTVKAEELARIRATNQFAVGQPVAAATGPRNKAAQNILDLGQLSEADKLKVDNYIQQIAGIDTGRQTHDFRDALGWGFSKAETEKLGNAQHRWMDEMADKAVAEANRRKLGGFDDWTHEKLQAAQWVSHKADDLGKTPQEVLGEMEEARNWLMANVFHEGVPSKELVNLDKMPQRLRRLFTDQRVQTFSNIEEQSVLAQQAGLLAPDQARFIGEYEGTTNPNIITTLKADPEKGGSRISQWSDEATRFVGALHGLLSGQADVGYSFLRPAKRASDINAARIPFSKKITGKELQSYKSAVSNALKQADAGDVIVNYRKANELEMTWLPPEGLDPKKQKQAQNVFRSAVKEASNGRAIEATNSGGLMTWEDQFKPSAWMPMLQNPKMRASVKEMLPKIADDIAHEIDGLPLTKEGKDVYKKAIDIIRQSGLEGVEEAVKKGALPTAVLGAILAGANQAPEQQSEEQGLL
jgi:hypothetical protein